MYLIKLIGWLLIPYWLSVSGNVSDFAIKQTHFYFLPAEHSMSNRVPETRPLSRCSEPSRINVYQFCPVMERTWPQRLYLAPSVPLCPYLHSHCKRCPAASTCDVTPRDKTSHSSDWSSQQPVSLCTVDGRTPSIYTEIPLSWSLAVDISGSSAEEQHILPLCFSVLLLVVWLCFLKWFCDFLCIFVSDQKRLLVFFSKTSTVSQWKPLCLVGILFVWCNIHPSLIWLVGWSVAFVSVRRQRKALC